jgi:hypothetical protein
MARRRKSDSLKINTDDLRTAMRECQDGLVELVRKGYGDAYNRHKIEMLRDHAQRYRLENPEMWDEVAAERLADRAS